MNLYDVILFVRQSSSVRAVQSSRQHHGQEGLADGACKAWSSLLLLLCLCLMLLLSLLFVIVADAPVIIISHFFLPVQ